MPADTSQQFILDQMTVYHLAHLLSSLVSWEVGIVQSPQHEVEVDGPLE